MHQHVRGTLPADAGPFPAGTEYSALDPELMLWTVAVIADSARHFYELLVRRLSADEKDALWRDYVRFGELFGMPRDAAPGSYRAFREYWHGQLNGDGAHLTPEAHRLGHAIMFEIPVPATRRPSMRVHNLVMLGALPPRVRDLYGLRYTPAHEVAFRGAVMTLREALRYSPHAIRKGENAGLLRSRRSHRARDDRRRQARYPGTFGRRLGRTPTLRPKLGTFGRKLRGTPTPRPKVPWELACRRTSRRARLSGVSGSPAGVQRGERVGRIHAEDLRDPLHQSSLRLRRRADPHHPDPPHLSRERPKAP